MRSCWSSCFTPGVVRLARDGSLRGRTIRVIFELHTRDAPRAHGAQQVGDLNAASAYPMPSGRMLEMQLRSASVVARMRLARSDTRPCCPVRSTGRSPIRTATHSLPNNDAMTSPTATRHAGR